MSTLYAAWAATLVTAAWLLPIGAIRMLAYRSGEVDHAPGMRNVALMALGLGAVALIACVVITVVIVVQG